MTTGADSLAKLHPALQHHIVNSLGWRSLRPLQEVAIEPLLAGEHGLLLAPTAGGKTEAAFFPLASRMLSEDWRGLSVLYVCPIKALLNNLETRVSRYAGWLGRRVELWHGDVGEAARRRIRGEPPDVLLTTPESLEVMLVSRRSDPKALFGRVRAVVVDELHAFAGDDRGWHLLAVLERIGRIAGRELQRVGLSATIGNPEELLDWLAGVCEGPRRVIAPVAEGVAPPEIALDYVGTLANSATVISRLHRGEKRLVFLDSRARVEELAAGLRQAGVPTFVSHSSLSLDERRRAEAAFAEQSDCVIVATSTLELGIDVGDLDRVIQIDAPATVASLLQRMGRTGRRPGTRRNCLFLTTSKEALLQAAGLAELVSRGFVEPVVPPPSPRHLFAQQILALALQQGGISRPGWRDWLGRMPAFAALPQEELDEILAYMIERGMLFDDEGLLWVGPEGERSYGYRNFMELFSIFTSPPLFAVFHGRRELGQVHESSFHSQEGKDPILLLGGRAWRVTHVDWAKHEAFVEPTDEKGRSRWLGEGRALGLDLCHAMRDVLAAETCAATLSQRAAEALAKLREDFAWIDAESTALVRDPDGSARWWTFAGLRANAALAHALGALAEAGRPDNLSIPLVGSVSLEELRDHLRELTPEAVAAMTPVAPDAIEGLKFSDCLPVKLAGGTLTERITDPDGTRSVFAEAVQEVVVGP